MALDENSPKSGDLMSLLHPQSSTESMSSGIDVPLWTVKPHWNGRSLLWWLYPFPCIIMLFLLIGFVKLDPLVTYVDSIVGLIMQGLFFVSILLVVVIHRDFKVLHNFGYIKLYLKARQLLISLPLVFSIGNTALLIYHYLVPTLITSNLQMGLYMIVTLTITFAFLLGLTIIWLVMIYYHHSSQQAPDTYAALGIDSDFTNSNSNYSSGSGGVNGRSISGIQLQQQLPEDVVVLFESQKQRIEHLSKQILILTEKLKECQHTDHKKPISYSLPSSLGPTPPTTVTTSVPSSSTVSPAVTITSDAI